MTWFDTGVNLLDKRFYTDAVLTGASDAGVSDILVISSDLDESKQAQACAQRFNSLDSKSALEHAKFPRLYFTAGIHPHYADSFSEQHLDISLEQLKDLCNDEAFFAIGECGLDYNRNCSSQENQRFAFEQQLKFAANYKLGVYLHERDAFQAQIGLLEKYRQDLSFAIAHCFTGNKEQLMEYLHLDCYIGITGWICDDNKASALQESVADLPLERLLLETDAPYLFPKNIRPRKRNNEPKYIAAIADKLSELTDYTVTQIKEAAFENAKNLVNSNK